MPLNWIEHTMNERPAPHWFLHIVNFHDRSVLFWWICPPSSYHKMGTHKHNQVLVTTERCIIWGVGRLNPVPYSVGMPHQAPYVVQSYILHILFAFGLSSSSIHYYHSRSTALCAQCCRMIYSWAGHLLTIKGASSPRSWAFWDVDYPYIVFCLQPCIPTENNETGPGKYHHVPVSRSWSVLFISELHKSPNGPELEATYYAQFFRSKMKRSPFSIPCWPDAAPPYIAS